MARKCASLGWGILLFTYGFCLLFLCASWGLLLSLNLSRERLINSDDNLQTLSARLHNETWFDIEESITGVSKVLVIGGEPDVVVYFDTKGNIMGTRSGSASILWSPRPGEFARALILFAFVFATGLILLGKREQITAVSPRPLGFISMGFVSSGLSLLLRQYYPLYIWGIVVGICLLLAAIVLSCIAFEHWYWSQKAQKHPVE